MLVNTKVSARIAGYAFAGGLNKGVTEWKRLMRKLKKTLR